MSDDELMRDFLEKFIELFGRPTEPIILHVRKTSEPAQPSDEAATATATQMRLVMKMNELFPSKYLRAADLESPRVETIDKVTHEDFKDDGVNVKKTVIHFRKNGGSAVAPVVVNKTNWKMLVAITGSDDDDDWPGHRIELRPEKVNAPGGKIVDSIRIHEVPAAPKPAKAKAKPDVAFDDSIEV